MAFLWLCRRIFSHSCAQGPCNNQSTDINETPEELDMKAWLKTTANRNQKKKKNMKIEEKRSGLNGGLFIRKHFEFLAENDSQDTVSFIYNWDPPPITWTHKTIKPNGKCAKWPFAAATTTTITFFFQKSRYCLCLKDIPAQHHWPGLASSFVLVKTTLARDESIIHIELTMHKAWRNNSLFLS